jgi:DNA replication protein DnaC
MKPNTVKTEGATPSANAALHAALTNLHLPFMREYFETLGREAAARQDSHIDYLARLVEGEVHRRQDRSIERRLKAARFSVHKTLEQFQWSWPKKINQTQIRNLFRLAFIEDNANVLFIGGVGVGKSHLAIALAHAACLRGHSVLFATAVDIINTLAAAHAAGTLKREMNKYLKPRVLLIDELGYLPIDKFGADALFQIISHRYECGPVIVTSNRVFKHWPEIFNNDSTLTSALLDRLLHHAETVVIEGQSYRMKDQLES